MKRCLILSSLQTMGAFGAAAVEHIEQQAAELARSQRRAEALQISLDRSEQSVRDLGREIERLKRELETAKLFDTPKGKR